ncbi:uncharacterized protein [Oryza sativa Japonica Group]|uniref:Expressed protein n=3 Tax=Oryza TaxID=4527 RepID=Q84M67_ORYSJ|nr:uncharacterized protein LOC4334850 [Oryza sativa Japonica Group]KAB8094569.1 hypothetical protein EE612_021771 [Oryza sativa]AAP21402.1 hypothetical protein [Oryza sativa Japonica Group]ABG00001.1 expressed protein [Oryza sativa Japonica Group]KAF2942449.1 hypothetical protein DAI22_03g422300 [Oryza sativa Japonica Group]BAF13874.1 Os03g0858200 [Oryza sativa Japonica Group]|eukprot:NP_001051960.1 Os03g0858200 [Oryza sativa Japonica Group]
MSSWMQHRRRSWTARLLSSASLPPVRLLVFFAIVIFFLSVSSYVDYKAIERRAEIGLRVFAAPLAAVTIFLLFLVLQHRRRYWTLRRQVHHHHAYADQAEAAGSGSPWVVALLLLLLLLMLSFQSSVHSIWFRPLWDSADY